MKWFSYIFLILLPVSLFGQFKMQLLDQNTGEPIPYATLLWSADYSQGTSSDINGRFSIPIKIDSIKVQALGYKDTIIIRSENWGEGHSIKLKPVSYSLPEISVKPGSLLRVRYEMDRNIKGRIGGSSRSREISYILGTQFKNTESGYINSVSIFFSSICKNCTDITLRLRVIEFDEFGLPGMDILNESIVVTPKRKRWHTIYLEDYNVRLNGSDFLVGIEWVSTGEKQLRDKSISGEDDIRMPPKNEYTLALTGLESEQGNYLGWQKGSNENWNTLDRILLKNFVPLIRVVVDILK